MLVKVVRATIMHLVEFAGKFVSTGVVLTVGRGKSL